MSFQFQIKYGKEFRCVDIYGKYVGYNFIPFINGITFLLAQRNIKHFKGMDTLSGEAIMSKLFCHLFEKSTRKRKN